MKPRGSGEVKQSIAREAIIPVKAPRARGTRRYGMMKSITASAAAAEPGATVMILFTLELM